MSGYLKTFKVKDKENKLVSYLIGNDNLLEECKSI